MNWKQQWIDEVLAKVPKGGYRRRLEAELCDHLETHRRALMEAGWTEEAAQTEALRVMGEPEALRGTYREAWRRSLPGRARTWAWGCVVMGVLYILTSSLLGMAGFTYDAIIPGRVTYPLLSGNKLYVTVYSTILFLLPFTLGALFLRICFRWERRPVRAVTAGLLAAWTGERAAIIGISALIYQMPLSLDLLTRIYHGGDTTAPWFSPVNYVLTFFGCILLGQVFGRIPIREKPTAAV